MTDAAQPRPDPIRSRPDNAPPRTDGRLTVALVSDTFWEPDGEVRLRETLAEAAERGADVAVLPELPLHAWSPATENPNEDDAEPIDGPRAQAQRRAAREAGVGLIGGIIHRDPASGRRTSRALIIDREGEVRATYDKLHLPDEPGFHETSHYDAGDEPPHVTDAYGLPIGVQLCSDTNRPEGTHLLGAQGAMAVLIPRATEEATFQRWKLVFRANALTSCCWVVSVNRPHPEAGVPIGGPSIVVDPRGEVVVETTDRVALATIDAAAVIGSRKRYPGYLPIRARLYGDAWTEIAGRDG
jgi:N-carbamoylputrescine amidase